MRAHHAIAGVTAVPVGFGMKPDWRDPGARTVKPGRRDSSRRVTPDFIEFYKKRAHDLRAKAIRSTASALWSLLTKIIRRR